MVATTQFVDCADNSLIAAAVIPGTVTVVNDPPTINPLPHDELDQYYKVLRVGGNPIPPNKQYRVKDSAGQTDEVPCMPIGV